MLHFLYMWQSYLRSGRWWLSVPYAAAAANCWNWVTCFFRNLSSVCMQLPLTAVHNTNSCAQLGEAASTSWIHDWSRHSILHSMRNPTHPPQQVMLVSTWLVFYSYFFLTLTPLTDYNNIYMPGWDPQPVLSYSCSKWKSALTLPPCSLHLLPAASP